jgi:hypothetical protein
VRILLNEKRFQKKKDSMRNMEIDANGTEIRAISNVVNEDAYISLTDIAKYKNPDRFDKTRSVQT